MQLFIEETYEDMSRRAADLIAAQLIVDPASTLGLATGSTPIGLYADLVEDFQADRISFEQVTTFNLDEYRGLSPEHDQSYRYFMQKNLFDHVDIDPEATSVPDGANPDAQAACESYEQAISEAGGIDLQLLGLGHRAHPCGRADGEHHQRQQPSVRVHRPGSPRGLHHGHRHHHEGACHPGGGQWRR